MRQLKSKWSIDVYCQGIVHRTYCSVFLVNLDAVPGMREERFGELKTNFMFCKLPVLNANELKTVVSFNCASMDMFTGRDRDKER